MVRRRTALRIVIVIVRVATRGVITRATGGCSPTKSNSWHQELHGAQQRYDRGANHCMPTGTIT
jgi:hypothetical protein